MLGFVFVPGSNDPCAGTVGSLYVWIGNDLSHQVLHFPAADEGGMFVWTGSHINPPPNTRFDFYPESSFGDIRAIPGDAGTFIAMGGSLYAPDFSAHELTATDSLGFYTPFTPVSQTEVTGSGTEEDPYKVVTVATAGDITIEQTDTYVIGQQFYTTQIKLTGTGDGVLYRAGDAFLDGFDVSYGFAQGSAVGVSKNPNNSPRGPIQKWIPVTPGNNFIEDNYDTIWSYIALQVPFPDTCQGSSLLDTGAGISWNFSLSGGSATFTHQTQFSCRPQPSIVEIPGSIAIYIASDLSQQAHHHSPDGVSQDYGTFYPGDSGHFGADGGTLLWVPGDGDSGVLYAPDFFNHYGSTAGFLIGDFTPFTLVSQTGTTGSGTPADPFKIVTVVHAGGITITQSDEYITDSGYWKTTIILSAGSGILYRCGDSGSDNSDGGFGTVTAGAAPGIKAAIDSELPDTEMIPITPGSNYFEGQFSNGPLTGLWDIIAAHSSFPNTFIASEHDASLGLSWAFVNGGKFSHLTVLRPSDHSAPGLFPAPIYVP